MAKPLQTKRLPHMSIVLTPDATDEDAKIEAERLISQALKIDNVEIVYVKLVEEGLLSTSKGEVDGKRYCVAFRELVGQVIFVHPDFDEIVRQR